MSDTSEQRPIRTGFWKALSLALSVPLATSIIFGLFADPNRLPGFPQLQQFLFGSLVCIGVGATVVQMRTQPSVYRSQKIVGLIISFVVGTLVITTWRSGSPSGLGGLLAPVTVLGPYLILRDRWRWLP
jgi:hypothetical protein